MQQFDDLDDPLKRIQKKYSNKLSVADWLTRKLVSNQGNKRLPFLNWFGLKESFSYELVEKLIRMSKVSSGSTFLDPFSGTGTSIFAAANYGMNAIGVELLPFGQFLYDTRRAAFSVDMGKLKKEINNVLHYVKNTDKHSDHFNFRHLTITQGAFPQSTEIDMSKYLDYVSTVRDTQVKQLLNFACFSILEQISFTSKDGQYLRWDKRAGRKRGGDYQKKNIRTFLKAISDALENIYLTIDGSRALSGNWSESSNRIKIIKESAVEYLPKMPHGSVDLVISSPPYCNRYDYTRTYALELAFLGTDDVKLKEYRQQLLSCTVENKSKDSWLRNLYGSIGRIDAYNTARETFEHNQALQLILIKLKGLMDSGELNNDGIYRMVFNYFFEHSFIIHEMARTLKQGGKIFYVNDNVRYSGISIPVDLILSDFAESSGLTVNKIFYLKRGKGNSSQQMGSYGRDELRKCIYFWEKP